MDGTTRPLVALLLVSLSGTACSLSKSTETKSVELPAQPVSVTKAVPQKENLDGKFAVARTFEQERDLERAASLYREILMKDHRHAGATHRLAIVCDQQGRHAESRKLFQRALELRPLNADLFCDLGYSLYCQQKWAQAERNFRLALEVESDHERARRHLGLALAAQGQDGFALRELEKSGCSSAEARANLALMQTYTGRLDEAGRSCELAREADPDNQQVIAQLRQVESVLAKAGAADPQPTTSPEVAVARKSEPKRTSIWAAGFRSKPTSAGEVTQVAGQQEQETAEESSSSEKARTPTKSLTRPLQRLLKWRRVDKAGEE